MAKIPEPACDPIPPEIRELAERVEARKDAALSRLQSLTDEMQTLEKDAFERAMQGVVDAAEKARGQ